MSALSPIDWLLVTAGQCALRTAPLPRELREKLTDGLARCSEQEQVFQAQEYHLIDAVHLVVDNPESHNALACLDAARCLVAEMRAASAEPGTPEARPDYYWQREGMGG